MFISIALVILCFFISLLLTKSVLSPACMFSLLWSCILTLSAAGLYALLPTSDWVYQAIAIGVAVFCIACFAVQSLGLRNEQLDGRRQSIHQLRYGFLAILVVLTIGLFTKDLIISVNTAGGFEGLDYVRAISQDSTSALYSSRSTLESALRMLVIDPFSLAFQVIVAMEFWNPSRKNWILLSDVLMIGLRVFSQGSRILIVYLAFHLIVCGILCLRNTSLVSGSYQEQLRSVSTWIAKRKKVLIPIVIIAVVVFIAATVSRSNDRVIRNIYYYFSMEPHLMESWLPKGGQIDNPSLGAASFNGFIYPLIYVVKNLFSLDYPEPWYTNIFLLINDTDQIWKTIAFDGTTANAYVSLFWFFYIDGGILGIVVGCALYGLSIGGLYSKSLRSTSLYSIGICSYLLQSLVFSFVRFQFASTSYALGIILLILLYRKRDKSEIESDSKLLDGALGRTK